MAELAPDFPGADPSYAVLMRYGKATPSQAAKAFANRRWTVTEAGWGGLKDADKRLDFVRQKRAAIEADWAALEPERRWLDELNAFDRIGDLTPPRVDADIISFAVWRVLTQESCAMAFLQVADQRGDAAIAAILPVLECSRKLQRDSRTLVRSMIGNAMERIALETAGFILERTAVSAAQRARLALAIANDHPGADMRRLVLIEYAVFTPAMVRQAQQGTLVSPFDAGWTRAGRPIQWLGSLALNPKATINVIGREAFELAALARRAISQGWNSAAARWGRASGTSRE